MAMKVSIVAIGNSRGVRLPKVVLEQLGFGAEAELEVEGGRVTLTPLKTPRSGWAEAFTRDPADGLTPEDDDWLDAPLAGDEDA
jgi:antitoxin MazE